MDELGERLAEIIGAGGGETVGETPYVPLLELESKTRLGLDQAGGWVAHPPGGQLCPFGAGKEGFFLEAIETKRPDFDRRLAEAAEQVGLPPEHVALSFPSVPLVRSVLTRQSPYLIRLALAWLVPTELRELRAEIAAVAADRHMPTQLRDLAARLTVPEASE